MFYDVRTVTAAIFDVHVHVYIMVGNRNLVA